MEESDLDLIVAGTNDAVCMIEGFAREIPEPEMGDAIVEAHRQCRIVIEAIERAADGGRARAEGAAAAGAREPAGRGDLQEVRRRSSASSI